MKRPARLGSTGWCRACRTRKPTAPRACCWFRASPAIGVTYQQCFERSIVEIKKAIPVARELGVKIAIENVGNNFIVTPEQAVEYLDAINSEWVGWHFDIGNAGRVGPAEKWIKVLGKRIIESRQRFQRDPPPAAEAKGKAGDPTAEAARWRHQLARRHGRVGSSRLQRLGHPQQPGNFVYKAAAEIGELGDNTRVLRAPSPTTICCCAALRPDAGRRPRPHAVGERRHHQPRPTPTRSTARRTASGQRRPPYVRHRAERRRRQPRRAKAEHGLRIHGRRSRPTPR